FAEPNQILNWKRPIQAVLPLHPIDDFLRGLRRQDGAQRVAGTDMDEQEADDADAERDWNGIEHAPQYVEEHGHRSPRTVGMPHGPLMPCGRVSGQAGARSGPAQIPFLYCSIVIGVRSWNQLLAWTNPFTFGEIARGLMSWTIQSHSALSTIFAWTCRRAWFCCSGSKDCAAFRISSSYSGLLTNPQLEPFGVMRVLM